MLVKLCLVATFVCTLQCSSEVESFEIIRNAIHKVRVKVHKIIHPNHIHDENCKHSHEHEDFIVSSTTKTPVIDIRGGIPDNDAIVFPSESPVSISPVSTTTLDPKAVPQTASRSIIGVSCPSGTRSVDGRCRNIVG